MLKGCVESGKVAIKLLLALGVSWRRQHREPVRVDTDRLDELTFNEGGLAFWLDVAEQLITTTEMTGLCLHVVHLRELAMP